MAYDDDDLGGMGTASREEFAGQTFGIYPRVSSLAQSIDDKVSLDVQIEACKEYGETLGMGLDPVCVRKEAYTATTLDRPQLTALLQDMKARKVRNLVIDRADRLTRQGMLAAATLLNRFTEVGILLHVTNMGLVVRNEIEITMFLQMAFAAQMANTSRIRAAKQAKHRYAREGRYLRGNRPPYGFVYEFPSVDSHGRPTKIVFAPDMREINGFRPWEQRRRICQLYLDGMSAVRISELFTHEKVPNSSVIAHHPNAKPYWNPSTILYILKDPMNLGVAVSLRTKDKKMDPDETHPTRWYARVARDESEQAAIPGIVKEPYILTPEQAAQIQQRIKDAPRFRSGKKVNVIALLRGGMARCGMPTIDGKVCGAALRIKHDGKPSHSHYYSCRRHEIQPAVCPGVSIKVVDLDLAVWSDVVHKLREPGLLESLAADQAALDTAENPASRYGLLKRTVEDFKNRRASLVDSLEGTRDPDTRATLLTRIEQLGQEIRQAESDLKAHELLAADWERKQAVLSNVQMQMIRYLKQVVALDHRNPDDAPFIHNIFLSLGVRHYVSVANGDYEIVIEYNLGAGTARPWFPTDDPKDMERLSNEFSL
jgi:DNA invertase Pin-like site-specific DNA recombinase